MDSMNNISQLGSSKDREFFRVDGQLYLHVEIVTLDQGTKQEAYGVYVPTFSMAEDDIVGLSIDAFREQILISEIDHEQKEYWLKLQQLLSFMKRSIDAELLGRKQKMFCRTNVNISGSGMAFESPTAYVSGQTLRLAMFFPRYPYTYLCVIGDVVKCEKKDEIFQIKTEFQAISEKNQDEILRFVNQCQRDNRKR